MASGVSCFRFRLSANYPVLPLGAGSTVHTCAVARPGSNGRPVGVDSAPTLCAPATHAFFHKRHWRRSGAALNPPWGWLARDFKLKRGTYATGEHLEFYSQGA
jgi:hypothetical protein